MYLFSASSTEIRSVYRQSKPRELQFLHRMHISHTRNVINLAAKTYMKKACFSGWRDGLVGQGRKGVCERIRAAEDCRRYQMYSEKEMCIITGNIVLLSAHLSFEGRRYGTYRRSTGHVKTAKICRILRHSASLTIHSIPHISSSTLRFSQNPFSLGR